MTSIWLILTLSSSAFGQYCSEIAKEPATKDIYQVIQKPSEDLHQIVQNIDTLWAPGTPGAVLPLCTDVKPIVGGNLSKSLYPIDCW